jgi:hypothetical protein
MCRESKPKKPCAECVKAKAKASARAKLLAAERPPKKRG